MLDIKLMTFLKVVELGSYTAAAGAMHLTQPAVTQHIAKLEQHYGCRFFLPEGRSMRLTEQGRRLHHYARMQVANERQLRQQLFGLQRPLALGSTLSIADYYLPGLLKPLVQKEGFAPHITVGNTELLLGLLLEGKLDAAFIEGIFDRDIFEAAVFCRPRYLPVAASDHPLVGRQVQLSELYDYPLVVRENGSGTRAVLENYLAQQNGTVQAFSQIWEAGSFGLIKHLLEGTNAVSFMYEAVLARECTQGQLCMLDVEGCQVSHPLHFVYLKNNVEQEPIQDFFQSFPGNCKKVCNVWGYTTQG